MTRYVEWPEVMISEDDSRPATGEEVEWCEICEEPALETFAHGGVRVCEHCRFWCAACQDEPVYALGEVCDACKIEREAQDAADAQPVPEPLHTMVADMETRPYPLAGVLTDTEMTRKECVAVAAVTLCIIFVLICACVGLGCIAEWVWRVM